MENMETNTTERNINILVIGETGVGKSTFINAFVNYMMYSNMHEAEMADEVLCLVPTKFTITDDAFQEKTVSIGDDNNESKVAGAAATQGTKSYMFPIGHGHTKIRIIDTPGIGDPRGIEQDNINFENILHYISQFDELHGICILLKPNNARLTVLFEFCVKQLLSRLEKSASRNIVFIFTNSRCTFYRPGDTLPALKCILEQIKNTPPHVEIPLGRENTFCLDNEAFRFLVSIKNSIKFTKAEKRDFALSWDKSAKACWDLIRYVSGEGERSPLTPHKVADTVSINRARSVILELSQPLAEIAQLIIDNMEILKRHKNDLKNNTETVEELRDKLYMPVANLKVVELPQPRTVCTSTTCCTVYQVEGVKKWHYSTRCHDPCYLNNVPKEIVGSPELINCAAINSNTRKCKICTCDYTVHMHIYYQTEVISDKIIDENVNSQITDKQSAMEELKKHIDKINKRRNDYDKEKDFIIKSTAKFAHFLQNNAITPYNDAYQAYIEYLIDRERSLGANASKDKIVHLQKLLNQYNEEKATLNRAMELSKSEHSEICSSITAEDIFDCVHQLYGLEYTGPKIEELFNKQKNARSHENRNTEYVHPKVISKPEERNKRKNKNKKNNQNGGKPYLSEKESKKVISERQGSSYQSNKDNDYFSSVPNLFSQVQISNIQNQEVPVSFNVPNNFQQNIDSQELYLSFLEFLQWKNEISGNQQANSKPLNTENRHPSLTFNKTVSNRERNDIASLKKTNVIQQKNGNTSAERFSANLQNSSLGSKYGEYSSLNKSKFKNELAEYFTDSSSDDASSNETENIKQTVVPKIGTQHNPILARQIIDKPKGTTEGQKKTSGPKRTQSGIVGRLFSLWE